MGESSWATKRFDVSLSSKAKNDLFEWLVLIFAPSKAMKVNFSVFELYSSDVVMISENYLMLLFDSCCELPSEKLFNQKKKGETQESFVIDICV